jgi:hypothetical protein
VLRVWIGVTPRTPSRQAAKPPSRQAAKKGFLGHFRYCKRSEAIQIAPLDCFAKLAMSILIDL